MIRLDEFLRRRAKLQRVQQQLNAKLISGWLQTLYWRRRFLEGRAPPTSAVSYQPITWDQPRYPEKPKGNQHFPFLGD